MASNSSVDAWTTVGKGGRPVSFPPEAAAAFGRRPTGGSGAPYRESRSRSEFPAEASAAFGRSGPLRPERAEFDSSASGVFSGGGGGSRFTGRRGVPEFDAAAVAAFGGGSRSDRTDADGFPSAFGRKKSVFSEAGAMGCADDDSATGRSYGLSALARKRAEAAKAKPQTYEELFPVLGPPAIVVEAAVSVAPTAPAKRTFADLVKERAATEEAEAEREALTKAAAEQQARDERRDRAVLSRLHTARYRRALYASSAPEEEEEHDTNYETRDLDYDAYGARHADKEALPPPSHNVEDPVSEEEAVGDAEDAGDADIY